MPTVSFYVRQEDYDKWKDLKSKGEFIHNALNPSIVVDDEPLKDKWVVPLSDPPNNSFPPKPIKTSKLVSEPDDKKRVIIENLGSPIKTPTQARKALEPLTKGHVTYFKKSKKPTDDFERFLKQKGKK